jgi:hypothetical protein
MRRGLLRLLLLFGCVFSVGLLFVGFGFLVFGGFLADKN